MKLAILLPGIVPDLYWLAALAHADRVVLNDIGPWSRKSRVHRYKIRTPQGTQWLNVPVLKNASGSLADTLVDRGEPWAEGHLRALAMNYRNSLYFDFYEAEIEALYDGAAAIGSLLELCEHMTGGWLRLLKWKADWEYASRLPEWHSDPDTLASRLGATRLWLEHDSRHYQRQPERTPIVETRHPEYRQHFGGFYEGCAVLDLLFSRGPESRGQWKGEE